MYFVVLPVSVTEYVLGVVHFSSYNVSVEHYHFFCHCTADKFKQLLLI